jgi:diphthamide synthase (EF-2-diphthine--ammonia ligase)
VVGKPKALLAWSSGKNSAWSLQVLRERGEVEVVGLLTTINQTFDRVAMHAVRTELLRAQAELPASVDPCGERGEFHTFAHAGPMFRRPVPFQAGEVVTRDGFVFADLLP